MVAVVRSSDTSATPSSAGEDSSHSSQLENGSSWKGPQWSAGPTPLFQQGRPGAHDVGLHPESSCLSPEREA